jgi:hypothetical protein
MAPFHFYEETRAECAPRRPASTIANEDLAGEALCNALRTNWHNSLVYSSEVEARRDMTLLGRARQIVVEVQRLQAAKSCVTKYTARGMRVAMAQERYGSARLRLGLRPICEGAQHMFASKTGERAHEVLED